MPISVDIAILRYRLYEIDRIINRTLPPLHAMPSAPLHNALLRLARTTSVLLKKVAGQGAVVRREAA